MQLGTHARKALCGAPGAEVHHFQSTHWSKIGVVGPFQADRPAYDRPMNSAKGVRSVPLTEDQGSRHSVLESLLEQCPAVWQALQLLPSKSILSLSATSSSMHEAVLKRVTRLSVGFMFPESSEKSNDWRLADCPFRRWSALHVLHLRMPCPAACPRLAQIDLPLLSELNLSILAEGEGLTLALTSGKLPKLTHLRVCYQKHLTLADLSQLAQGQWPELTTLNISDALHRAQHQPHDSIPDPLADSRWPKLKTLAACGWPLQLFHNTQCKWPELASVEASYLVGQPGYLYASLKSIRLEPVDTLECLANVLAMQMPCLEQLDIFYSISHQGGANPMESMASIVRAGPWPALTLLRVRAHGLGLTSFAPIQQAFWPHLQELDLAFNHLNDDAVHTLSMCDWPELGVLDLGNNVLGYQAAVYLSHGKWPALQELYLHDNHLDDQAMQCLHLCAWPCLSELDLSHNKITKLGLRTLLLGQWPKLESLCMENNAMSVDDVLQEYADAEGRCVFWGLVKGWLARYESHVATQVSRKYDPALFDIWTLENE